MKYKICLFDFDYTLADATNPIVECFKHTFETMNLCGFDEEKAIKTIGLTLDEAFLQLTEVTQMDRIRELVSVYRAKSDEITVERTVLFDDTLDTLKELRSKGMKIGIVSSRMGYRIEQILNYLGCREYVDNIIGYEDVEKHKPSPEGLQKALKFFDCRKEEVLYIGDSYVDAKAAQDAGIDFIGVTTGTTKKDEFGKYKNIEIVDNLKSILEFI